MDLKNKVIVFDLDDTIYKEINFLKSGFRAIIKKVSDDFSVTLDFNELIQHYFEGDNVFEIIINRNLHKSITINYLLDLYRNHFPNISISEDGKQILQELKERGFILSILTDGRSKTQRNKLKALNIERMFHDIVISEEFGSAKPNKKNYEYFQNKYPNCEYFYIGDNLKKDFISPNKLGWVTIGLRDTRSENVHSQQVKVSSSYLPKYWINDICELNAIIN